MRIWQRILGLALLIGIAACILMPDPTNWQYQILLAIAVLALLGVLVQPAARLEELSARRFKILLGLLGSALILIQLLILIFLPVTVYHDPFRVLAQAAQMAGGNYDWNITYFWRYSQNVPIAWLLSRWLVVTNWLGLSVNWGVNLLEMLLLDGFIGLTLLTAWQLTRRRKMVLGLLAFFMLTPFAYTYYLQIFYTDLPNMLILMIIFRQLIFWSNFSYRQRWLRGLLLSGLTALGMLIKANLIVLVPAILLTVLIMRPKRSLKLAFGAILVGVALSVPVHAGIDRAAHFQQNDAYRFPTIAWVTMGMNERTQGTYSSADVIRNINQKDLAARQKVDQKVLKKRLASMGAVGIGRQVIIKDGILLDVSRMTEWYNGGFKNAPAWYLKFADHWHELAVLLMSLAAICLYLLTIARLWQWHPQRYDDRQTVLMLLVMTALGYLGFHALLWEAEPRYGQAIFPLLFLILMLTKPVSVPVVQFKWLKRSRPVTSVIVLFGVLLLAWNQGLPGSNTGIVAAQRSQLSTQYHARPTLLAPRQTISQQIRLLAAGSRISVQTYTNTDLKVELQNLQTKQKWQLTRHGDSYHLCQHLGVGTYQITVTNPTSKPQPIAILKTNHYQMADRPLILNGHAQKDASLIYLISNQCD